MAITDSPSSAVNWLSDLGNAVGPDGRIHFGDRAEEQRTAITGSIVVPLLDQGSIRVSGPDADTFLQGQLSNDLALLRPGRAQLSSFNSPKGRVLNLFVGVRTPGAIYLVARAELVPATLKRLQMFVMRSKVQLEDARRTLPALGVTGPAAGAALAALGFEVPSQEWDVGQREGSFVVRHAGPVARFSVHAPAGELREAWEGLKTRLRPVGPDAWRLLEILAGMPSIVAGTQDHFVAQMLNLDGLGGISFTKGCYTGQEVIARLHYLGSVKRRMLLAFTEESAAPAGTPVVSASDGSTVGEVVDAAPHPERGTALQVVMQLQHAASRDLRLGEPLGAPVSVVVGADLPADPGVPAPPG